MRNVKKELLVVVTCFILVLSSFISRALAETINIDADVAVVGAGGTGLAAALTLAEGGAKVVVFEKMDVVGGSSNRAEGIFAVESRFQRLLQIDRDREQAFKDHMEFTHWRANPRLVKAFIDKSAETIEWLLARGVNIEAPRRLYPGNIPTWHVIQGFGETMINALHKRLKKRKNAKIYLRTPGKKLLMENGRIAGLIAENEKGDTIQANTKAVILAAGGFGNNKKMLDKYIGPTTNMKYVGNPGNTGDGIKMAWEVGAAAEGMNTAELALPCIRNEKHRFTAITCQPFLWLNLDGERFTDESNGQFAYIGNALFRQKDQEMFTIFDENMKRHVMEKGIIKPLGSFHPPGTKLKGLDLEIKEAIKNGEAFVGNSLKELAGKMGVPEEPFVKTVKEYNKFCHQNLDEHFYKHRKFLQPIETPKFYAYRSVLSYTTTLGGIKINHKTEVLNDRFEVIPGLYAGGSDAGGLYGDTYAIVNTGGSLGFALNSGRIAGENALQYIGK